MKLASLAVMMLLAGCAGSPPRSPAPSKTTAPASTPSAGSFRQDLVECERQAALAGAGAKGKALDSCLRARGHTPGK